MIGFDQPRPCYVDDKKALCYGFADRSWTHGGGITIGSLPPGQESVPCAIVEFESGDVETVNVCDVKIIDSGKLFRKYSFNDCCDCGARVVDYAD